MESQSLFLLAGFIYMGIPGFFTALSFINEDYNDIAGFLWLIVGIFFYWQYGLPFIMLGTFFMIFHFYIMAQAYLHKTKKSALEGMK